MKRGERKGRTSVANHFSNPDPKAPALAAHPCRHAGLDFFVTCLMRNIMTLSPEEGSDKTRNEEMRNGNKK